MRWRPFCRVPPAGSTAPAEECAEFMTGGFRPLSYVRELLPQTQQGGS